jgi:predicted metalloprotease with PDZ domain
MSDAVLRYRLNPAHPTAHRFAVTLEVPEPEAEQVLLMPAWTPGTYSLLGHARHVFTIRAEDDDGPVELSKLDRDRWCAQPRRGVLRVHYEVYAWEPGVRAAQLDLEGCFFNGPCLFLLPEGAEGRRCELQLEAPEDPRCSHWRVATTLPSEALDERGFGRYAARDYDELMDHPVRMGRFDEVRFEVEGVAHEVALSGRHRADLSQLEEDLGRVCAFHAELFGAPPPCERYLFLVNALAEGYGGLEHRSSSVLVVRRGDLPDEREPGITDGYRKVLGLFSHEYMHTWWVKAVKPAAFVPYDWTAGNRTRQLWVFEGVTSYYDDLALLRAGLIDTSSYLEVMGRMATRVWRTPGRAVQNLEDASFDAWSKYYARDENSANAQISYYSKGAVVALCADLRIRALTGGERSLDDVMRLAWERHGDGSTPMPEGGFEVLCSEVAGASLEGFFDSALRATEELPLGELLLDVGVRMNLRAADSGSDRGGRRSSRDADQLAARAHLGVSVQRSGNDARVSFVRAGSAAERAGLAARDVIVAVEGLRVTARNLRNLVGRHAPGERVRVHAFRRDELLELEVELEAPAVDTVHLEMMQDIDADTRSRRDAWLFGDKRR